MTTEPRINSFCWVELATNNSEQAKTFYRGLFGWDYQEDDLPGDMGKYISALVNKKPAAAMFQMPKEMKDMNIPPHWGSYIRVESVEQCVEKAKSLGAEILRPPMDVMGEGRMAGFKDPSGAFIHVWEKKATAGAAVQNEEQGAFSWNELLTNDTKKARDFYCELFSWHASDSDFSGKVYTSFKQKDGHPVGGMMPIDKTMGNIPPHWGVYFTVKDINKTAAYVTENGGKCLLTATEIPGMGHIAVFSDPQGAHFSVFCFSKK